MTNRELMQRALQLAAEAAGMGEVPVGSVIARNGEIIAEAANSIEKNKNPLCHAELICINNACEKLGRRSLDDCTLYVTLEPCPMCAGAIINARVMKVVYGAYDLKAGSVDTVVDLFNYPYNHRPEVQAGFMEKECREMLSSFFADIRKQQKQ